MHPNKVRLLMVAATAAVLAVVSWAQGPELPTSSERIVKVTDDIYVAMPTSGADSNGWIFINDDDVLIVDTHWTPARARTMIENIKKLTPKPVRYVVDTHYHTDHALGNQSFLPDVQLIGHEYTRQMMLTDIVEQRTHWYYTEERPLQMIATLKTQIAAEADPGARQKLEYQLALQTATLQAHRQEMKEVEVTPPFVTFKTVMTLHRGKREFQLHFLGRAHTGGDIVVYLPQERMIATGDFFGNGLGYLGDGWINEWPDALEKLRQFDFTQVLPGHGQPFDRVLAEKRITGAQGYFRDLWREAVALRKKGLAPSEAAAAIDLTRYGSVFPQISSPGVDVKAVERIYDVLDGNIVPR